MWKVLTGALSTVGLILRRARGGHQAGRLSSFVCCHGAN